VFDVGSDPDVLAFDSSLRRLYVARESGTVTIFSETDGQKLEIVGNAFFAPKAHTVAVDSTRHKVYFPLENVDGKPVLRVVSPTDSSAN